MSNFHNPNTKSIIESYAMIDLWICIWVWVYFIDRTTLKSIQAFLNPNNIDINGENI